MVEPRAPQISSFPGLAEKDVRIANVKTSVQNVKDADSSSSVLLVFASFSTVALLCVVQVKASLWRKL